MDAFNFCWQTLVKESEKHKVYIWETEQSNLKVHNDVSLPIHRIVYVYLRGTYIINVLQDCMLRSIIPQTLPLYYQLAAKDICNICCLSTGPGLEIVGFLSAFRKHVRDFKSVSVTVVSNFIEWRDFSEALICSNQYHSSKLTYDYYSPNFFEFISCNPRSLSPEKNYSVLQSILKADVIIMHRYYTSCDIQRFTNMIQEITSLMKKDALLFFLHSKTKQAIFTYLEDKGIILIPTMGLRVKNIPYDESISSIVGVPPKTKGSNRFTLWKKKECTRNIKMGCKENFQNLSSDSQCNSHHVKHDSESSMFPKHSHFGNFVDLPQHNLDINSFNFSNSTEILSHPKSYCESVETALYKIHSSDFKEDTRSTVSKTSSDTSVKPSENNLPKLEAVVYNTDSGDVPKSDKESEIPLDNDSFECEQSKIITMIEHCERMVTNLEEKIGVLEMQLNSSKNLCNHFCACYRCHICHHHPSHQKYSLHSVENCWQDNHYHD